MGHRMLGSNIEVQTRSDQKGAAMSITLLLNETTQPNSRTPQTETCQKAEWKLQFSEVVMLSHCNTQNNA